MGHAYHKSYAKKVDGNHGEIREELRKCGIFVQDTHELGHGCPDLLTRNHGTWEWWEIKMPGEELTEDEIRWWQKVGRKPQILRSKEEALLAHGIKI